MRSSVACVRMRTRPAGLTQTGVCAAAASKPHTCRVFVWYYLFDRCRYFPCIKSSGSEPNHHPAPVRPPAAPYSAGFWAP